MTTLSECHGYLVCLFVTSFVLMQTAVMNTLSSLAHHERSALRHEFTSGRSGAPVMRDGALIWTRTDANLHTLCTDPPIDLRKACDGSQRPASTESGASLGRHFFRIVQYNTFRSFTRGTHTLIIDWLAARGADYASLNELNGLNETTFAALGAAAGFRYSAFLRAESGYHMGFLSKSDAVTTVARIVDGFHHGVLHVTTASGLHFFVTHLTPLSPMVTHTVQFYICVLSSPVNVFILFVPTEIQEARRGSSYDR